MTGIDLGLAPTITAIVGAGINAGVYLTFSTFTMNGLRRLPASQGAAAAPSSSMAIAGAALYLSSIVITGAYNVPLNDRLAAVDAKSHEGAATWNEYQRRWTRGNHVRGLVSGAAAVLLTLSLIAG